MADAEIEAETAQEAAQEYVDGGDWGDNLKTIWITVGCWPVGTSDAPDAHEHIKIQLDPNEIDCGLGRHDHDWQAPIELVGGIEPNPGCRANNGPGVTTNEICLRCGLRRQINTGAQDPYDGQRGYTAISYNMPDAGFCNALDAYLRKRK